MNRPEAAGNGPGEARAYARSAGTANRGHTARRGSYGGSRVARLSEDDLDALFSALPKVRFVAFDFETTGLSPATERVVEIGAIAFRMARADDRWLAETESAFQTLVNPGRPIPAETTAIHGIRDADVAGAPSFAEAAATFFPYIDGSVLVAHNAPFDRGFLRAEAAGAGLADPPNPAYDTIALAKTALPRLPSYSLKALAAVLGIGQSKAHRGDDDARVCMELFVRCINLIDKRE